MRLELDNKLWEKYPKIFRDRHGDMRTTCMTWGFECGDGWYNIIDQMCALIQWHVDGKRKKRVRAMLYNRALQYAATNGDISKLVRFFNPSGKLSEKYVISKVHEALFEFSFEAIPPKFNQVVAIQVKEKFGTLRFYTSEYDEYLDGVIRMAEGMSGVTCEVCGSPGITSGPGWIRCLCETHREEREARYK